MSGVYIKGMQMPVDDNGKMEPTAVWVYPNGYAIVFKDNGNMQQYTQAIPVPPHGRLIDADALCEGRVSNDNVVIHARCAPTIIPADKEGEA